MTNGAVYAKRIKRLFHRLRREYGRCEVGEPTDPTEQLFIAILGRGSSRERGRKAFERLRAVMVDLNEVRVSAPAEVAGHIQEIIPEAADRAKALVDALNAVYRTENETSLSRVGTMGRREARQYLERLPGVDPYAVASVILWSLGGHAIPVNEPLLEALRANDLVARSAGATEVQSFLERHVSAADGPQFCLLMERFAERWHQSASSRRSAKAGGDGSAGGGGPASERKAKGEATGRARKQNRTRH